MLRVTSVCASYGSVQVLNGVDLELADNEVLAMIGRNGVGKTTLMRVLIGLLKPTKGTIQLDTHEISRFRPHAISRQGIAYVPQGRGIFPKLTVHENLIIGTRAQNSKPSRIPPLVFDYFPMVIITLFFIMSLVLLSELLFFWVPSLTDLSGNKGEGKMI